MGDQMPCRRIDTYNDKTNAWAKAVRAAGRREPAKVASGDNSRPRMRIFGPVVGRGLREPLRSEILEPVARWQGHGVALGSGHGDRNLSHSLGTT
jgi:hypothetical protein